MRLQHLVRFAWMLLLFAIGFDACPMSAQHYKVLYSFTGGADGALPIGGLILDENGNLYGTSIESLNEQTEKGIDVILDIDSQGAGNIKKIFQASISIYILPPSVETLEKRLNARAADDSQVINSRVSQAVDDLKESVWYDYMVVNDDLEKAVNEAVAIITANRCRNSRMAPLVKKMLAI